MKNKISIILIIISIILTGINFSIWYSRYKSYPSVNRLHRENGMIHHPIFGIYPEEVDYYQGMPIMPGQAANVKIQFEKSKEKL